MNANSHMAPGTGPPQPPKNFRWTAFRLWLAILLVPATFLAFCTICTATTWTADAFHEGHPWPRRESITLGLVVGALAGIGTLAGFIYQMLRVSR